MGDSSPPSLPASNLARKKPEGLRGGLLGREGGREGEVDR